MGRAGDLNGDGIGDLIIGAPEADLNGDDSGGAYVVFGGAENLSNLDRISGGLDGKISLAKVGSLVGTDDADDLIGTAVDDQIFGLRGRDTVSARKGNDVLYGGGAKDVLNGQQGDDVLNDGRGQDTLIGGRGADTFKITARDGKRDIIEDYEDGVDRINLRKWDIGFDELTVTDKVPGRVRVEIEGEVLTVKDGGAGDLVAFDLTADDFLF